MASILLTAYHAIAKGSFSALAGQAFSKAQLPSLASAATYAALSVVGEKATGTYDTLNEKFTLKHIAAHIASLSATAYITPKLTQKFFNTAVSTKMSCQLAFISLAIHLTNPLLAKAKSKGW